MLLLLLAAALICLCAVYSWRREWKDSLLYLQGAVICALVYALWAQSNVVDYQRIRIRQLIVQLKELGVPIRAMPAEK